MHDSSFGSVLDDEDVQESMLPEKGTRWLDTYALKFRLIQRTVVVEDVSWNPHRSTDEVPVWDVRTKEDRPWGRVSTMTASGFLSRFEKVE
ncbi:hypothetical protein SEA_MAGRITTE_223 [Microbacterium phage Magritte]|nr:hypothetical protein SEA_MAGRITTE_223 [Microbacterium phage Magritte]